MCIELENITNRNLFLESTNSKNIMTRQIWRLIDYLLLYENCQKDELLDITLFESRIVNITISEIL